MSNNIRIKTTPGGGEKNLKVKINQKFDFIEVLSLKISQDEAYRRFCSDYGAVIGRVIVNNGFGVPNAKVSIFIPIDDEDKLDPEIFGLYPYEVVTDRDEDGVPYNLLPRNNRGKDECYTTIGTFPSKREIQDNPEVGEIYCKYYKFTTTTNNSGDFMLFGVPVGTHYLHVDADISDIGLISQRPYDLISQGADSKKFYSASKFKNRRDNPNLPQLKTVSPVSVTVVPFWGDTEECEIGITRADVDLKTTIIPSAIFMGSIVTDSDKNSVNKNCRPRKRLGNVEKLVAGEGTIEMIRYTNDGAIERFDIEGGQLIDDKGTWAYQIPMNLDYKVTAEDGTLIPSEDPTKGIPTRSRARFKITMNSTGGEGRLRTRAAYLVPHNPSKRDEEDYTFGTSTRDENFRDLFWNKIYTVKNHIPRVQNTSNDKRRTFIGIKDVDEGTSNPFPFNRLHSGFHPLFFIICLLLTIITQIICVFNSVLFPLINFIIQILNVVLGLVCNIFKVIASIICISIRIAGIRILVRSRSRCKRKLCIGCWRGSCRCKDIIPYIPFILLQCPEDPEGLRYAPCGKGRGSKTFEATERRVAQLESGIDSRCGDHPVENTEFHYANDNHSHESQIPFGNDAGFIKCMLFAIADALNVFSFDFYNDWVNGTLFAFLFKYKYKKRGPKFCDWDESKKRKKMIDTCTGDSINDSSTVTIREGYLKRYEGELFYPPYARSKDYKLFATDITSLGAVFDCDWQGIPKLYPFLLDTSYKRPPFIQDWDEFDNVAISGFDNDKDGYTNGVYNGDAYVASINCTGLQNTNCNTIRRICEIGMGLDERREFPTFTHVTDNQARNNDIENPFLRGALIYSNNPTIVDDNVIPLVYLDSGGFNGQTFDYSGEYYGDYRNVKDGTIKQYDNSFYYYFGLNEGNTALTKLMTNFFPSCVPEKEIDFFVIATNITDDDLGPDPTGAIEIEVIGGIGPYTFEWFGPILDGVQYTNNIEDIDNLYTGTYTVTVTDSAGNQTEGVFIVPGPPRVICDVQWTDVTINGLTDGEIMVSLTSGQGPYNVKLYEVDLPTQTTTLIDEINTSATHTFTNIAAGDYYVVATDSGSPTTQCDDTIRIWEPQVLNINPVGDPAVITDYNPSRIIPVTCNGADDGYIFVYLTGGVPPYEFDWNPDPIGTTGSTLGPIEPGTYEVTVTDTNGATDTASYYLDEPPEIVWDVESTNITCMITPDLYEDEDHPEDITEYGEGVEDGSITVTINGGGQPPYNLTLRGGFNEIEETITELPQGHTQLYENLAYGDDFMGFEYEIIIEDSRGCIVGENVNVSRPEYILGGILGVGDSIYLPLVGYVPTYEVTNVGGFGETSPNYDNNFIGSNTFRWYIFEEDPYQAEDYDPEVGIDLSDGDYYTTTGNPVLPMNGALEFIHDVYIVCEVIDNNGTGGQCTHITNSIYRP